MTRVNRVEHRWDDDYDRWMYIEYNEDGVLVGLNYSQGDDYEFFLERHSHSDKGLTEFFKQMRYTFSIEEAAAGRVEFINKCMWSYHSAVALHGEDE